MQIIDCKTEDWRAVLKDRGLGDDPGLQKTVAEIIADVRFRGDASLLEIARRFDSAHVDSVQVDPAEIDAAAVSPEVEEALTLAFSRILDFHRNQFEVLTSSMQQRGPSWTWKMLNFNVGQRLRPLKSAGLYVPGGRASYPSSVLMLAGPAIAAGVEELVVTTPADSSGHLSQGVLAALKIAGIRSVFKIGGASAIAALAFGTETVPKVQKVAGPGNKFVNEAKRQLWGTVGVDGQYGPSEVAVVVDGRSNPDFAAADLITQIEHAPDNLGFLVSIGQGPLDRVLRSIEHQTRVAPRAEIIQACLDNVKAFVTSSREEAADVVNLIAPEHLTLSVEDSEELFDRIENAGCVLMGDWTPESIADYCLGPCHALPTNAAARFASPLNVLDFVKIQSTGHLVRSEVEALIGTAASIAEAEGFPAHGYGAKIRDLR